jgi:hypothetical protein
MIGWARLCFWLLFCASWPALVFAQAGSIPVHLEESSCATVPRDALEAALRVELGARVVEGDVPGTLRVRVGCPGDRALVGITHPDGRESASTTSLRGVSNDVRPRVIALTIAEIVRNLERLPEAEPVKLEPPRGRPLPAPHPSPRSRIGFTAHGRSFGMLAAWLAGGGLGARRDFGAVELGMDGLLLTSERETQRGSVRALAVLARPAVGIHQVMGLWSSRLGVGTELGFASLRGHAQAADARDARVNGAWVAPYVFGGGGYRLTPRLELGASLELGWALMPVIGRIQKSRDVRLGGPWAGLSLGVSYAF